jgi:hypothetical protein
MKIEQNSRFAPLFQFGLLIFLTFPPSLQFNLRRKLRGRLVPTDMIVYAVCTLSVSVCMSVSLQILISNLH